MRVAPINAGRETVMLALSDGTLYEDLPRPLKSGERRPATHNVMHVHHPFARALYVMSTVD